MQDIVTLISTVGFPIAACCAMAWYVKKQADSHQEEIHMLSDAVNNNTLALTQLKDSIEYSKKE